MKYKLILSDIAKFGLAKHKKSGNQQILNKINQLFNELREHPETGTGKPEQLKFQTSIKWSRRINDKHRLVYKILDSVVIVEILHTYGHYDDK